MFTFFFSTQTQVVGKHIGKNNFHSIMLLFHQWLGSIKQTTQRTARDTKERNLSIEPFIWSYINTVRLSSRSSLARRFDNRHLLLPSLFYVYALKYKLQ